MRIPSQFNEDTLYRRGRRGNESVQTYRRLLRLVIGLVLVTVVMRQASRPAIYQTFFSPAASATAASASATAASGAAQPTDATTSSHSQAETRALPVDPEDLRLAGQLGETLTPPQQREWVVALSRWQSSRRVETAPSTMPMIRDQVEASDRLDQGRRESWIAMLDALKDLARGEQASVPPVSPASPQPPYQSPVAAFLSSLDAAADARVVDGSVWRSGDFDAFYRYLDQADALSESGVALTGVVPLLQQPDVFRGQLVRVHGGVARAERIQAKENPYALADYWQLWLRPAGGADRPIVVIVRSVPTLVGAVGANTTEKEGPHITVVGKFLKRLAYQSSLGADLAPVVVGRIASAPVPESETVAVVTESETSNRFWITVAAAALIGFALAALAMWRTTEAAKRARQLRTSHRREPDQFLKDLGDSRNHADSPSDGISDGIGNNA